MKHNTKKLQASKMWLKKTYQSLIFKLILANGLVLSVALFSSFAFYNSMQSKMGAISTFSLVFLLISVTHYFVISFFVNKPINLLINSTKLIAKGSFSKNVSRERDNEMGQLESAINEMGGKIDAKQAELNRQRDEYQNLFEQVPCIITVQDRDYKIIRYNSEFSRSFDSKTGEYCFYAYKGRNEKCFDCPVEKTFTDGLPHISVETGLNKENELTYWVVKTSPIRNENGDIVAAMEMCLDITPRKQLEEQLEKSEKKYYAIFNNIPNPVFILKQDTLEVIDCNDMVRTMYGYTKEEMIDKSFMIFFPEKEKKNFQTRIETSSFFDKVTHVTKTGNRLIVNIRVSPSDFPELKVFLVTTSDITSTIETEQQLIQAGKMATLGEMATGVAHELNQPLTVIKTASSFFMRKINQNEPIPQDILQTMSTEIDSHVDRASKIINHLRQFGRKSDMALEKIDVNEVLIRSFEIFSRQLRLREIEVSWHLDESLSLIIADPYRLEQVFVNLLLNARDVIEEKWKSTNQTTADKIITISTKNQNGLVIVEVEDTGTGIPDGILDKIFEPFFTTKKVGQGTGLGLSISYGIIKECGGNIYARSKGNEGARFIVTFPKANSE